MGRTKGSKNKNPKNTSKIEGKEGQEQVDGAVEQANQKFTEGLSGEIKELYIDFSKRQKLPLDDLRELAQSMKARYNIGVRSEFNQHEERGKLAKEELKEIEETGLVHGRKESPTRTSHKKRKLREIISKKYYISSQLTTLSTELRNVFVEIERIEAGQPKGNVNIFNFLKGKGDKEKVDALEEGLFTPDEELSNQLRRDGKNDS